jgi:hypothetical protein
MTTRIDVTSLRGIAIALLLAGSALPFLLAQVQAQDGVPDLVGKWSGTGWGVVFGNLPHHQTPAPQPRFKQGKMTFAIDITQQQGRALIGTWASPNFSERLIGVVRSDNKNVHFVDEDSHFNGIVLSDNEMEVCVQEAGEASMVATCYILRR